MSLILRTATRPLGILILLFALFLLWRGHNEPGGGFIAGLVAGGAFALHLLARGPEAARSALPVPPLVLVALGLLTALVSGLLGSLMGKPFLTGQWGKLPLPRREALGLGTPLLFDAGVFLLVAGITTAILLALAREDA
jgi:multicomponent Na+:H+ antiporter subunit B